MTLNENTAPDGRYPYRSLFNTEKFVGLRDRIPEYHHFVCGDVKLGDCAVVDGINGWLAPFGGIDWRRDFWKPELIHEAICSHDWADLHQMSCKPALYSEIEPMAMNALYCAGWRVHGVSLNFAIPATSPMNYMSSLPRQTRHTLQQSQDGGMNHAVALSDESWRECYDLLAENRRVKGRKLSLDFDYVLAMKEAFGELVTMHATFDASDRLVAAALLYRVAKGIDVVQWHGDLPEHGLPFSPMPYMVASYVMTAMEQGATVVDLGISSNDGVPDPGLCRFKRSVGAIAMQRLVLQR